MADKNKQRYNNPFSATLSGIADLFKRQVPAGELKPTDRLDGKTVLVDGASSGLGFAVAVEVASRGARVIMACRSGIPEKGELVKKLSGNNEVHMLPVDFSDIPSIRNLISSIQHQFAPIDIYICNAGIVPQKSRKTPQGLEEMFMVNYFSKFLFINLLIEKGCFHSISNKVTEPQNHISHRPHHLPRIIIISSESHRNPENFDWNGFGKYKDYGIKKTVELYGYYKLLLTTFAVELSRRINHDTITLSVFPMCPGPINSNIAREAPGVFQPLLRLVFSIFFRSPAKAAIPVIYLATSPDEERKSFDYLFLMGRKEVSEMAADPGNGKRLWELSEQLAGKFPDNKI